MTAKLLNMVTSFIIPNRQRLFQFTAKALRHAQVSSDYREPVTPRGCRDCQHSCPCVLRQTSCWAISESEWKHIFWNGLGVRTRTVN